MKPCGGRPRRIFANTTGTTSCSPPTPPRPSSPTGTGVLIPEGLLDEPFSAKIGKGQVLQVVAGGGNAGNGYKLDGTNNITAGNAYSVECVISNVVEEDAYDLATHLNGNLVPSSPGNLTTGCVEYLVVTNGTGTLYMYVAGL